MNQSLTVFLILKYENFKNIYKHINFINFYYFMLQQPDDEQSIIPEFDRSAVLKNYADNIIIPRLNNFSHLLII